MDITSVLAAIFQYRQQINTGIFLKIVLLCAESLLKNDF